MAESEGLKCNKNTKCPQENKPTAQSSIWRCITGAARWTDIIKLYSKTNKAKISNVENKASTTEENLRTAETKITVNATPKMYNTNAHIANDKNEIKFTTIRKGNTDGKPLDKIAVHYVPNITQYRHPTLHRPNKRNVFTSSSQEADLQLSRNKQHVQWMENVRIQEFYKLEKELPDKSKAESQKSKKKTKDEKTRIIVLLLEKVKKLETQIRDLQFLNIKKKTQKEESNKKIIKRTIYWNTDENKNPIDRYKNIDLSQDKTDLDIKNCKIPVIKIDKTKILKREKRTEYNRTKRKRKLTADIPYEEHNNNENQIKEYDCEIAEKNKAITSIKDKNFHETSQNIITHSGLNDQAAVWLLVKRIKCLETQLQSFKKPVSNHPIHTSIFEMNSKTYPYKENRQDLNRNEYKKLINMKVLPQKPENHKKNNLSLCYPVPQHTKAENSKVNNDKQENNLITIHSRTKRKGRKYKKKKLFEIVKKITNEKIAQTSKQYFKSMSKTEISEGNQHGNQSATVTDTDQNTPTKDSVHDLPTKDSNQSHRDKQHENEPESEQDEGIIKIRKVRYTCSTMRTQKLKDYNTERTISKYCNEGETTGDNYESGLTDDLMFKTTTEDDDYDCPFKAKMVIEDKIIENENNENIATTTTTTTYTTKYNYNNSIGIGIKQQEYNLFQQKRYISAHERQKIEEEAREQQRRIYAKKLIKSSSSYKNNTSRNSVSIRTESSNKNNSLLQTELYSSSPHTSSDELWHSFTNRRTEFSKISSKKLEESKSCFHPYHNFNDESNKNSFPIPFTEHLLTHNKPASNNDEYLFNENIVNPKTENSPLLPSNGDVPFTDWFKEEKIIKPKPKWKSLTTISTIDNDFVTEVNKRTNLNKGSSVVFKKDSQGNILSTTICTDNNNDILMNVIQLSQPQIPVENVSNVYLVLVNNNKKDLIPKKVTEDKIKEMISNLKNSIDDFIIKGCKITQKKPMVDNIQTNSKDHFQEGNKKRSSKEKVNKTITNMNEKKVTDRKRKNNKSDTQMIIKQNKSKKLKNKSDTHMIVKQNKSVEVNNENYLDSTAKMSSKIKLNNESNSNTLVRMNSSPTVTVNEAEKIGDIDKKLNLIKFNTKRNSRTEISKCYCSTTGTNVCFPPVNYVNYNLSTSQTSSSATDKSYTDEQLSKQRKQMSLILKLQKEIELQKREVDELKNIWSKCSSRLDDIWQTNINPKNEIYSDYDLSLDYRRYINQSNRLVTINPFITNVHENNLINHNYINKSTKIKSTAKHNKKDERETNESDIFTFENSDKSGSILSGIFSEAPENNRMISETNLQPTESMHKLYQFKKLCLLDGNIDNKIYDPKDQLNLNMFQREASAVKLDSQRSSKESSSYIIESDFEFTTPPRKRKKSVTSEKSTQTAYKSVKIKSDDSSKNVADRRPQKRAKKTKHKVVSSSTSSNTNTDSMIEK